MKDLSKSESLKKKDMHEDKCRISIIFNTDYKFFALLPAINIDLRSEELIIEWLFFGLYIHECMKSR